MRLIRWLLTVDGEFLHLFVYGDFFRSNYILYDFNIYTVNFLLQGVYKCMVQFQKLSRNLFLTLHGQNVHR